MRFSSSLDCGGLYFGEEDPISNSSNSTEIGSQSINFTRTEEVEVPGEEGEDPTTEAKLEQFEWCPDHIQLRDQSSGEIYELSINNGQIVLTNLSL